MRIKKYELFLESRRTRSEVELFMERFDKMVQSRSYRKGLIVKEEIDLIKQFSTLVQQSMINEEYDIVGWLKDKFGQSKDWIMSLVDKIQDYKFVEKLGDKAKAVFDYLIEKGGELKRKAIIAICKLLLAVNKGYIKVTTFMTLFMIGNVFGAFGMRSPAPAPEKVQEVVKTVEKVIPHVKDVPVEKIQENIFKIGETTLSPEVQDAISSQTQKVVEQAGTVDASTIAMTAIVLGGLAIGGYLLYKATKGDKGQTGQSSDPCKDKKVEILMGSTDTTNMRMTSLRDSHQLNITNANERTYFETTWGELLNQFSSENDKSPILACFRPYSGSVSNTDKDYISIGDKFLSGVTGGEANPVTQTWMTTGLDPSTRVIARGNGLLAMSRIIRQARTFSSPGSPCDPEMVVVRFQTDPSPTASSRVSQGGMFDFGEYFKHFEISNDGLCNLFRCVNRTTAEQNSMIQIYLGGDASNFLQGDMDVKAKIIQNVFRTTYWSGLIPENIANREELLSQMQVPSIESIKKMLETQSRYVPKEIPGLDPKDVDFTQMQQYQLDKESFRTILGPEIQKMMNSNIQKIGEAIFGEFSGPFISKFKQNFGLEKSPCPKINFMHNPFVGDPTTAKVEGERFKLDKPTQKGGAGTYQKGK